MASCFAAVTSRLAIAGRPRSWQRFQRIVVETSRFHSLTLVFGEQTAQACVNAFHEKAGRSQVGSFVFSLDKVFSPAESPLSPPFHPHSSLSDCRRSVQVGCSDQ